jgi:hypothetical protein
MSISAAEWDASSLDGLAKNCPSFRGWRALTVSARMVVPALAVDWPLTIEIYPHKVNL